MNQTSNEIHLLGQVNNVNYYEAYRVFGIDGIMMCLTVPTGGGRVPMILVRKNGSKDVGQRTKVALKMLE